MNVYKMVRVEDGAVVGVSDPPFSCFADPPIGWYATQHEVRPYPLEVWPFIGAFEVEDEMVGEDLVWSAGGPGEPPKLLVKRARLVALGWLPSIRGDRERVEAAAPDGVETWALVPAHGVSP